jgi:probable HAF family extracellular repeat protein
LSTASGVANGINRAGQVVGQSPFGDPTNPNAVHATLWNGSSATDLGTLAGAAESGARGINASGQVVGLSFTSGSTTTGTLWQGGKAIALSPVGGIGNSTELGINDAGAVVGWSASAPGTTTPLHATLWEDGNALDLNTLVGLSNLFTLTQAVAINNNGQIAADGIDSSGRSLVFLLNPTPVPLPASVWLLAFALGGLAASSRKKSARTSTSRGSFPALDRTPFVPINVATGFWSLVALDRLKRAWLTGFLDFALRELFAKDHPPCSVVIARKCGCAECKTKGPRVAPESAVTQLQWKSA